MKNVKIFFQFLGVFLYVFIGFIMLPTISIGIQKEQYVNKIVSLKGSDNNDFMDGIASVSGFTYQKTPALSINQNNETLKTSIKAYYVASTGNQAGIDGIAFLIDGMSLYNENYTSISVVATYPKEITLSDGTKSMTDTTLLSKDALIPIAIISDYHGENEIIPFKQVTINFHSNENIITPVVSFGSDSALIMYDLSNVPFDLTTFGISQHISSSSNVPTEEESSQYDLFYRKINISMFSPNFLLGFTTLLIYLALGFLFFYFVYISPLLKYRKKSHESSK